MRLDNEDLKDMGVLSVGKRKSILSQVVSVKLTEASSKADMRAEVFSLSGSASLFSRRYVWN
jgi:hypothetical protein